MLAIFQLRKEHIGLREYLAIPNNGVNKEALSFAIALLQKNTQEAISRNLLKKEKANLKLTKARRSIRMDCDPEVWIPKEFFEAQDWKRI